jgi:hypothetical protein
VGFNQHLKEKSKKLVNRFSLPTDQSLVRAAWTEFVVDNGKVHIKADLSLKQSRVILSPPLFGKKQVEKRTFLSESLAYVVVEQFATRLNYRIYKNAFRRFNKRLNIISCIEGGRVELRDDLIRREGESKRFHTHLLIELPKFEYLREGKNKIPFNEQLFMQIIEEEWIATEWGYYENNIERINSTELCSKYQTKYGFGSVDLRSTHINHN